MRYKLEIHLLFSRVVTTTDTLFKKEDKKKKGREKRKEASDQVDSFMKNDGLPSECTDQVAGMLLLVLVDSREAST